MTREEGALAFDLLRRLARSGFAYHDDDLVIAKLRVCECIREAMLRHVKQIGY